MTQRPEKSVPTQGEMLLRQRTRRFWIIFLLAAITVWSGAAIIGYTTNLHLVGDLPKWVPLSACFITIAGWLWFAADYFGRIDELDLHDNFWAHLTGFYLTLASFGIWYVLDDLSITSSPTATGIMVILMFSTFSAYSFRKLKRHLS